MGTQQLKTRYQYINFIPIEGKPEHTTLKFDCYNNHHDTYLGAVAWYAPWRQYCFMPSTLAGLVFNRTCLADIQDFLQQLMNDRRK